MYRIFILSLLAIVFATFALESPQIILRATEIRSNAMVLEWSPIEGSSTYKVFYDEQTLINPKVPDPILESPSTDKTRIEITKMLEGAEYYFVVRGYDAKDIEVGETLPLHASTLNIPAFGLKEAKVIDDQHVELTFSQPVDATKTQIDIMNSETKNIRGLVSTTSSDQDLRIITIVLKGKLEPGVSHDVVLKKVTNIEGMTLPIESSKKTTISFSPVEKVQEDIVVPEEEVSVPTPLVADSAVPPVSTKPDIIPQDDRSKSVAEVKQPVPTIPSSVVDSSAPPVVPKIAEIQESVSEVTPEAALADLKKEMESIAPTTEDISLLPLESDENTKVPVPIDTLPRTGASAFYFLLIAIVLGGLLSYKKKTSL